MKMKTTRIVPSGASPTLALSGLLLAAASLPAQPTNGSGPPAISVNRPAIGRPTLPPVRHRLSEVGPNYRLWTAASTNSASGTAPGASANNPRNAQRHRVVEITTGMNYWDGQQWAPSDPSLVDTNAAFVASKVQHKVSLAGNLNTVAAVSLTTPDGIVLRSTPVAIGLYDAASGQSLIIAALTNCAGALVTSNQVVYSSAFAGSGVCADIVYRLERGSFQQDVVITGPLSPQDWGFPTNSTRIQIITEFYGAPEPDRITHPIRVEKDPALRHTMATPDLVDQILGFGEFVLGAGRATTGAQTSGPAGTGAPVVKEFKTVAGRTFLIESVEYGAIRQELDSLPPCSVKTASVPGLRTKAGLAYAAIPRPPQPGQKVAAGQRAPGLLTKAAPGKSGLVIDYVATLGGSLYGTTVFQGDTTYFVSGVVYCNGPTTIEGGAVFKYPHASANACIYLNNTVTCATSAYCPAIFTAGDDENIGETLNGTWSGWSGTVSGYYANPALDVYYVNNTTLSNLRFNYAQEGVRFECYPYTGYYETLADSQFADCVKGIEIVGLGSGIGTPGPGTGPTALTVNNTLLARIQYPLTASSDSSWTLYHCTADQSACLASSATTSASFSFVNSVFANVTNLSSGNVTLGGNYNGFYAASAFGSHVQTESQSPFAPTQDGSGNLYLANGQGGYYLRDGSPFVNSGTTYIGTSLKNDLAQRTTTPGQVFANDVNSTTTLSPQPIRDTDTPDLGYHYPAVDYVINGATVNNCTLNIDQGTVLAYQGYPYIWGLRLNAGGRLNVNGVPTNHVIFAHLEAVQEHPAQILRPFGAMLAFREVFFAGRSTPATPLPEAKLLYADFLTLDGGYNLHVGPLETAGYFSMPDYANHACVGTFVADGCRFQGGEFYYEDGGPQGRTVLLRNSIFERVALELEDSGNYGSYTHVTEYDAQVTAANNLFYSCAIWLMPCSGGQGAAWTFIDNLFDQVDFNAYDQYGNIVATYNGPVGNNHHNGYIGMSTYLSPENQPATDPKLSSLSYASGSLGRFYLPSSATALIDAGSRSASAAGLYHFTTQTTNAKEATSQVDIGPHFLALVSGQPADSNGDGIPDFIADRDGDGIEDANEVPWQSQNNGSVMVLSPVPNLVVSGIIQVQAALGASPSTVSHVTALVDGQAVQGVREVANPAQSTDSIEIDTTLLSPGTHSLSIETSSDADASLYGNDQTATSQSISFSTANPVSFANWQNRAQLLANLNLQADPSVQNFTLHFFNSTYPKAMDPAPIYDFAGAPSGGTISYSQPPANLGYGDASTDPTIYSFTEFPSPPPGNPPAVVNQNISQDPAYPCAGWWAAAYDDQTVDYYGSPALDQQIYDPTDWQGLRWKHDDQLNNAWFTAGGFANDGTCPSYPPTMASWPASGSDPATSLNAQTWPVRGAYQHLNRKGFSSDLQLLRGILRNPSVRNFYVLGHGSRDCILFLSSGSYCFQRYRFAFLDGCESYSYGNFSMFGAVAGEIPQQQIIAFQNAGFTDTSWYHNAGLRPAAFMGHMVKAALNYDAGDINPNTGQDEPRVIEAVANWHYQFFALWVEFGEGLYQAKLDADNLAWTTATGNSSSPYPQPHQPPFPAGKDANDNPIWWSPVTCLKIAGYLSLKFRELPKTPTYAD